MPIPLTPLPDWATLRELIDYNPKTGVATWRLRHLRHFQSQRTCNIWNTRWAGTEAFTARTSGYRHGAILNKPYRAHRVLWKWMTGEEPEFIDHVNGRRDDNRWVNLRSVAKIENEKNVKLRSDNTSGQVGVQWSTQSRKWIALIYVSGCSKYLGVHDDIEDAIAARKQGEIKYKFHKNHGRTP